MRHAFSRNLTLLFQKAIYVPLWHKSHHYSYKPAQKLCPLKCFAWPTLLYAVHIQNSFSLYRGHTESIILVFVQLAMIHCFQIPYWARRSHKISQTYCVIKACIAYKERLPLVLYPQVLAAYSLYQIEARGTTASLQRQIWGRCDSMCYWGISMQD